MGVNSKRVEKENKVSKFRLFQEKVATKRPFQILAFIFLLGLTVVLVILVRNYLDLKAFLPYGYLGIFILNLLCSLTIIFPVPGEAINIGAAGILNPFWIGMVAATGGTLGELSGYYAGYLGRRVILDEYLSKYQKAELWMKRYGSLIVFVFALFPFLIFDLVGLAAGALRFPLWKLLLACWAGRVIRSIAGAYLGWGIFHFFPGPS